MTLAQAAPDSDVALEAALLTLNTTFYGDRDTAIDLLVQHHVESPRLSEAVTCLSYTSRGPTICKTILEFNTNPSVIAHAQFQIAYRTYERSDAEREAAKETLRKLVKSSGGIQFHPSGWGPPRPRRSLSDVAMKLLSRINQSEEVKIGTELKPFSGLDVDGQPISLADYNGKVTELERHSVERYQGQPFEILGICGDDTINEHVHQTIRDHRITWRSVRDNADDGTRLSESMGIGAWPTCILLDRDGIVRQKDFPTGIDSDPASQEHTFQIAIEKLLAD